MRNSAQYQNSAEKGKFRSWKTVGPTHDAYQRREWQDWHRLGGSVKYVDGVYLQMVIYLYKYSPG